MLYRILRFIIGNGMRLYYREIKVKNKSTLNQKGPMIIVANHPNTLIDAWIIAYNTRKPVYYLTKGTFFNNPFKKWILKQLYMIPINRTIDSKTSGVDNRSSFEACYEVLENGGTLVIFPEGNSLMENTLRDLKTGTARIALETQKRGKISTPLKICPVGFFYSKGHRFRSAVLANVGATFTIEEFESSYIEASTETAKTLTNRIKESLENLIVGTEHQEQEKRIERILQALQTFKKTKSIEIKQQEYKLVKQRVQDLQMNDPSLLLEIEANLEKLEWSIEHFNLHPKTIIEAHHEAVGLQLLIRPILVLLGLPFFLLGTANNIIPFKLTQFLMPKLVSTREYYAPVAILLGIFLYPLNYLFILFLLKHYLNWNAILLIGCIPIMAASGIFAFHFSKYLKQIRSRVKIQFSRKLKSGIIQQIEESIEHLKMHIFPPE